MPSYKEVQGGYETLVRRLFDCSAYLHVFWEEVLLATEIITCGPSPVAFLRTLSAGADAV